MSNTDFLTIRAAAKRGPLAEYRLRLLLKQGRLPGVYVGTRFLVQYSQLLAMLDTAAAEGERL